MLYRGQYQIPWGCQFKPYDPYEMDILGAAGKVIHGHRGREQDNAAFGYRYFLFHPRDAAMSWTAFVTRDDLQTFLDAYGLILDEDPAEGAGFRVAIPAVPVMAPLTHVATEIMADETGLSLRVAKLSDEPYCPQIGSKRPRRLMHLELWNNGEQVASFQPFTVGPPPSIHLEPDQMTTEESQLALAVLIGSMSWESRWTTNIKQAELVNRVADWATRLQEESCNDPQPQYRPR